ncbi:MAG: FkbM family methyltransferase [Faecalibacterium sp.]|nr:FkbM family methyltransferase [Ruminococcus sp.]MCM1392623.1 FkbM family methyltransferase [Ruminococcus sp.]MCM1486070.1 FkbM family methyltransferase [Faecalibacterium sp.]
MVERINEISIWDYLTNTSLPIVLYGMGNGADMIIDVLHENGLDFADVFASDAFVRGHYFHGKKVLRLCEVEEKYDEFIILMTFAIHDEPTLRYVENLSKRHILLSPTVPIAGKGLFTYDYICEHEEQFDAAYSLLADKQSRKTFIDVLNFKVSGKTDYLFSCQTDKSEVYTDILKLCNNEHIVDLGAYDGDTIREFLNATDGNYGSITAFEPDEKNFRKLERKTESLKRIERYNLGAWSKKETLFFQKKAGRNSHRDEHGIPINFDSVDNVVKHPVSFIKMDIEGAESEALDGARKTIEKYKPKLYVCAYHRNEDMFALPLKIHEMNPNYKIYFRHHPYIPAWESNFYCVNED